MAVVAVRQIVHLNIEERQAKDGQAGLETLDGS